VSSDEKRRACLSWVGPETYVLLQNLCGDVDISRKSLQELTEKLSVHFTEVVHVQAARYAFYNCKMQPGHSYSKWAASPRGVARDCRFICKSERCNHASYVDDQIRDVIIKETPRADVRRQCLNDPDESLDDVLKKAETYVKTLRTDQLLKGESDAGFHAVHKMSATFQSKADRKDKVGKRSGSWKSCPQCFSQHTKSDCPFKRATYYKCGKKGHIKTVCKSERTKAEFSFQQRSSKTQTQTHCVGHIQTSDVLLVETNHGHAKYY